MLDWTYNAPNGKAYECKGGFSYSCPALKLYGYAGPSELEAGIRRELKRRAKAFVANLAKGLNA